MQGKPKVVVDFLKLFWKEGAVFLLVATTIWATLLNYYLAKAALIALFILSWLFLFFPKNRGLTSAEKFFAVFGSLIFLNALLSILLNGLHSYATPKLELYAKYLLPLPLLLMLTRVKLKPAVFWWIICIASYIAGTITVIEVSLGYVRAKIHGQAIIFGNLAIMCSILSLVSFPYFKRLKLSWVAAGAFCMGTWASIYSETRGGWIALPPAILLYIWFYRRKFKRVHILLFVIGSILFGTLIWTIPESKVQHRVDMAYSDLSRYLAGDTSAANTPVGARLEMWYAAWEAFKENPLLGIGVGEFNEWLKKLDAKGKTHSVTMFKHAHNEYFEILMGRGLLGFFIMALFVAWMLRYFYRTITDDKCKQIRPFGLSGLLFIITYLQFCLTESFFSTHLGAGFFVVVISLLIHFIESTRFSTATQAAVADHL